MSRPITTFSSPTFKIPSFSRLTFQTHYNQTIPLRSLPIKTQSFRNPRPIHKRIGFLYTTRKLGFCLNAENGGEDKKSGVDADDAEILARGDSTMPDRFRYLTKEAPDPPVRWPYFVGMFLSLGNPKKKKKFISLEINFCV